MQIDFFAFIIIVIVIFQETVFINTGISGPGTVIQ